MNILLYGFDDDCVQTVSRRYGFALCDSFEHLDEKNNLMIQPRIDTEQQQMDFYKLMEQYDEKINAVISAGHPETFSTVHYCSQIGKFYSVDTQNTPEDTCYQLCRIIETSLGLLCAHEMLQ